MNEDERLVQEHLRHQGFNDIVHEPDGKVPPDFLLTGRIAVEVRRLNQNEDTPVRIRGLEELSKPLIEAVKEVLDEMGATTDGVSWFVGYEFSRPLPPWRILKRALTASLTCFKNHQLDGPKDLKVCDRFSITLIRASKAHPTLFVLAGSIDYDSGGWVLSEMQRNIGICIAEKTKKVANVRHKYPEWWLVLVDRIGYGLGESDRHELRKLIPMDDRWDKIILVNPLDPAQGFEL